MSIQTTNRVQPGVREGGQFTTGARTEPDVALTPFAGGQPPGQQEADASFHEAWTHTAELLRTESALVDKVWEAQRRGLKTEYAHARAKYAQVQSALASTPLGLAGEQARVDDWSRDAADNPSMRLLAGRAARQVSHAERDSGLMAARDGHLHGDEAWRSIVPVAAPMGADSGSHMLRVSFVDEDACTEVGRVNLPSDLVLDDEGRLTKSGVVGAVAAAGCPESAALREHVYDSDEDW